MAKKVIGCNNTGEVSGGTRVGGVIGTIQSNSSSIFSTIENSKNSAKVTANGYIYSYYTYEGIIEERFNAIKVGGIVGYAEKVKTTNTNNTGIVENLSITDDLVGIGGIVGELRNGDIINSFNAGEIKGNSGFDVGGIVGGGYYNININNCYNMNNITGKLNVGGIAGGVVRANIKYCYNTHNIKANSNTAGGIVGVQFPFNTADYEENSIWYCYNIGSITGNDRIGSVVGYVNYHSSDYFYGLTGTSNLVGNGDNYKGNGTHYGMLSKTDLISMVLTNYGSNFKADTSNKNGGYPILSWQ